MVGPHIGIAQHGKVALWCRVTRVREDGAIRFYVINGDWTGWLHEDHLEIEDPEWDGLMARAGKTPEEADASRSQPAELVWQGEAPFDDHDYNEAIRWIQDRVDERVSEPGAVEDWLAEQGYDRGYILAEEPWYG